ncbi:MAG TPA: cytochrome c5 family protein [Gammaproteobacteria bacterium]|nr:cytochrome c5 family protein [Gammaproteobacteria bacterium]
MNQYIRTISGGARSASLAGLVAAALFTGCAVAAEAGSQDEVLNNIRPVGQVNVGEVKAEPASAPAPAAQEAGAAPAAAASAAAGSGRSGEQVYNGICKACHSVGVAGAPKVGDKAAWEPRAAQGMDTLMQHVTNGLKAMPPKGTCADCSADELKGAVEYMLKQTGL